MPEAPPAAPARGISERRAGGTHPAPAPAPAPAPERVRAPEGGASPVEAAAPSAPAQCHGGCLLQAILDEDWKLCAALIEADEDGQQCAPGHFDRRKHWNAMHFFASKGEVLLTGLALDSCGSVSLAEPPRKSSELPCRASGGAEPQAGLPRLGEARRGSASPSLGSVLRALGWGSAAQEQVPAAPRQSPCLLRVCPAC